MLRKIFVIFILLLFSLSGKALAFKPETFVTFGNPVRGPEGWQTPSQSPLDLPIYQYKESTTSAFPLTWLLRYDAVQDATMSAFFNGLIETDKNQTLGAFLEITPQLAKTARVTYPAGLSIFSANRIFLSGYSTEDRQAIIDTYMEAFFGRFGFYPKSVSAWHLDSFSLEYLQSKYSVLLAMNCDDQYSTDHYRLWGGYLGSPYFPDKNNSLIPADSLKNRVNLTMVRWAQRDLFNFYGPTTESIYSIQINDYLAVGQNTKYFEKLMGMYEQKSLNDFTYVNIGLENDYSLALYKKEIRNVYQSLKDNHDKFSLHPISLSDFGDWFKARYPESTPAYFYEVGDPKESVPGFASDPAKIFWYQSPYYRIGFKSNGGRTEIIDFRVYNREIYEDYYATPNQSLDLFHEVPAVIDMVKYPGTAPVLFFPMDTANMVHSKQWDSWEISFQSGKERLTLYPDKISFTGFAVPTVISKDIGISEKAGVTTWSMKPFTPFKKTTSFSWLFWLLAVFVIGKIIKKIKKTNTPQTQNQKTNHVIPDLIGNLYKFFHNNFQLSIALGLSVAFLAGLTVFRNGLLYPFGMGFWGPNGHDAIFHLSFIEKFSNNFFSFSHPQIAGEKIANYHFIFDFISGLVVRIFGVSSIDFYFRIFPVLAGLSIVFLLDKLLKSWNYTRLERLLSIFLVFLAGSFGFIPKLLTGQDLFTGESAFWSNQSVSIFLNPPFALSIIVLLLFLVLLSHSPKESPRQVILQGDSLLVPLALLGALLAQTKIYAFVLLLGALLFSRKYKLFFGVLILGTLISLPFTILGGSSPFIFSPLWFPRSLFASFDRFYWPQLVSAWQAYEASGNFIKLGLVNLFALVVFLLGNLGMRVLGLIQMLKTKAVSSSEEIVRWITLFGLLLPILFIQNINPWNTIQFMYYALFFLAIFTAKEIHTFIKKNEDFVIPGLTRNLYKLSLLTLFLLLATLTSVGTLKDYLTSTSASRLSYTELLALDKLRDQPRGIVLAPLFSLSLARAVYAPKPLYSYVSTAYISALSGQPEYLADTINLDITGFAYTERARWVQRFYNTEDRTWGINFLKENHIRYVYETPLQKLKLSPVDLGLTKIFDSGEINVYKFN